MEILKTLVGSRLHGLHNDNSDYDWRGIFKEPVINILSPFKKQRSNSWIEGKEDDTSYELIHFCKLAASCNPTVLEVLWSSQIKYKDLEGIGDYLIDNRLKFLDTEKIYLSHLGYAENQIKKMDLYNPHDRTPKAIVAYIRVMRQGTSLLKTLDFNPVYEYDDRDFIMDIKYNFSPSMISEISNLMLNVRSELETAKSKSMNTATDVPSIETFLKDVYVD
jgi:predicted nucleotidyltransferase